MADIHLVRHGEVHNPNHVVYADLEGFDLSPVGVLQAHGAARALAHHTVDVVLTSPLARAVHTATAIAARHGLVPVVDVRLTETGMYPDWTGRTWEDVSERYRTQFDAYLSDPTSCLDADESIAQVAERALAAVQDAVDDGASTIVVVGHQDPLEALRLTLVGEPLSGLLADPPRHGEPRSVTIT